jgi:hypothetical protein
MTRGLLLVLLVGCQKAPPEKSVPVVDSHTALRDQARLVLESRCGSCHISSYPTAAPPALAVFDLVDPDWSRKMTEAQLLSALDRVKTGGGDVEAPLPTARETQTFVRFVDAELARRGVLPHPTPNAAEESRRR